MYHTYNTSPTLSPISSFKRSLASASLTRIPVIRDKLKLAPEKNSERTLTLLCPKLDPIPRLSKEILAQDGCFVSFSIEKNRFRTRGHTLFASKAIDGARPELVDEVYHGMRAVHDSTMGTVIHSQLEYFRFVGG